MRSNGRPEDPHFHPDEYLFRRVPTEIWDDPGDYLGVEAVQLPDISVGRSKYGHAEWVRFDTVNGQFYEEWGIVGVQVKDVPPKMWRDGYPRFAFRARHLPDERNYPHSEIRAYDDEKHVDMIDLFPEDVHLEWRERLLRKVQTIIKPHQKVVVRDRPPASHKPEPPQQLPE
jgi:hypothetical protein